LHPGGSLRPRVKVPKHRDSAPPVRSSCGRGPCRGRSEQAAFHGTYGSLESATGTKTLSDLSRMREGSFSEAITPSRRSLLSSEFGGQCAGGAVGGVEQGPMDPF